MATFASRMAQDVRLMNQQLQETISSMGGVASGVKTFLDLATQAATVPQRTTIDVLGPGGVREVSYGPNPVSPYEPATIGMRRGGETREVVEAINNLGTRIERTFGGTGGATIRAKGGY